MASLSISMAADVSFAKLQISTTEIKTYAPWQQIHWLRFTEHNVVFVARSDHEAVLHRLFG